MGAHARAFSPGIALEMSHACKGETDVYVIDAIKHGSVCLSSLRQRVRTFAPSEPSRSKQRSVRWYEKRHVATSSTKRPTAADMQVNILLPTSSVTFPLVAWVCSPFAGV